jgi:hypothetical protein
MSAVFLVLFPGVVAWWISIPSHDRPWRPEVAVMPRAIVDGDRVRIMGVRNFDYRSVDDFAVRYEEREVQLSHLTAVDFFVSYWTKGPVGHTFLSFIFDNAPPLSISIETRPEMGEGFDPLASLFKQFELIYVVGDEHDIVRVRTNFRKEAVYLYRLASLPDWERRLFLVYMERINELADRSEFYHLLSNSCTINIIRYLNAAGRSGPLDIRHIFNGLVDNYLYYADWLDTSGQPGRDHTRRDRQPRDRATSRCGFANARIAARFCIGWNAGVRPTQNNARQELDSRLFHFFRVGGSLPCRLSQRHQYAVCASKRTTRRELLQLPQPRPRQLCPMSNQNLGAVSPVRN